MGLFLLICARTHAWKGLFCIHMYAPHTLLVYVHMYVGLQQRLSNMLKYDTFVCIRMYVHSYILSFQ